MQVLEQFQDLDGGGAVEIARGLVGKQDVRIVGQSPRDGHALALPTREGRRKVLSPIGEADTFEKLVSSTAGDDSVLFPPAERAARCFRVPSTHR